MSLSTFPTKVQGKIFEFLNQFEFSINELNDIKTISVKIFDKFYFRYTLDECTDLAKDYTQNKLKVL